MKQLKGQAVTVKCGKEGPFAMLLPKTELYGNDGSLNPTPMATRRLIVAAQPVYKIAAPILDAYPT
jgi:hypothetical protein